MDTRLKSVEINLLSQIKQIKQLRDEIICHDEKLNTETVLIND